MGFGKIDHRQALTEAVIELRPLVKKMKLHYIKVPLARGKTCISPRVFGRLQRIDHPCPTGFRYSRYLVLGLFLNFIGSSLISSANPASAPLLRIFAGSATNGTRLELVPTRGLRAGGLELDRSCPIVRSGAKAQGTKHRSHPPRPSLSVPWTI